MAKSKLIDEVIQNDVELSDETIAEVEKAVSKKDAYAIPELKKKDLVNPYPGHATRGFRS
jgi:hypothetical protein